MYGNLRKVVLNSAFDLNT